MPIFKKKIIAKNGGHFEFSNFSQHKNAYISKTMLDRAISIGYLCRVAMPIFKKFCLAKNGGHFEFSNFCAKIAKYKNANISKIVLHRAISTKFLIFRVSLQSSYPKELSLGEVSDP